MVFAHAEIMIVTLSVKKSLSWEKGPQWAHKNKVCDSFTK